MLGTKGVDEHVRVVEKASHGPCGYIRRQRAS
jgi:hypothetical protein